MPKMKGLKDLMLPVGNETNPADTVAPGEYRNVDRLS